MGARYSVQMIRMRHTSQRQPIMSMSEKPVDLLFIIVLLAVLPPPIQPDPGCPGAWMGGKAPTRKHRAALLPREASPPRGGGYPADSP